MYEYLEGRVVRRSPARVVVDVAGVGYDVAVPVGTSLGGTNPGSDGQDARVWTHLVVREDSHQLFGFSERGEREMFRLLLSVRGVGPALALGVLSSLPGDRLLFAVVDEDLAALTSIKGVGKKTAEQILLDLREKAQLALAGRERGDVVQPAAARTPVYEDAVQALTSIGYSNKEAKKSVERAIGEVDDPSDLEVLVRTALQG